MCFYGMSDELIELSKRFHKYYVMNPKTLEITLSKDAPQELKDKYEWYCAEMDRVNKLQLERQIELGEIW